MDDLQDQIDARVAKALADRDAAEKLAADERAAAAAQEAADRATQEAEAKAEAEAAAAAEARRLEEEEAARQEATQRAAAEAAAAAEARRLEEEEAARQAHRAAYDGTAAGYKELETKLEDLKAALQAALADAAVAPEKLGRAQAFARHGHLILDEWLAWMKRS